MHRISQKNNRLLVFLLLLFVVGIIGSKTISFLEGYDPYFSHFWLDSIWLLVFGILSGIGCLIVLVVRVVKRKAFLLATIIWVIIACFGALPGIFYVTAGSMLAISLADPDQVIVEGRMLALECQQQQESQSCLELAMDYPAIGNVHPQDIVILEDNVLLLVKLHGFGDIAGFLVYPEDMDSSEQSGDIRIRNGLFWYESHH